MSYSSALYRYGVMGKDKTINQQLTEQVLITKQTIQRVLFSREEQWLFQ